jgi:uncharacterized protein (DUF1499 family)
MRFALTLLVILALALAAFVLAARWRSPGEPTLDAIYRMVFGSPDLGAVDIRSFSRRTSPNDALAAPPGTTVSKADIETAPLALEPTEIWKRLEGAITARGESFAMVAEEAGMRRYIIRTPSLRFPDTLIVELAKVESGQSIALYSASQIGYDDFKANRMRVEAILSAMK